MPQDMKNTKAKIDVLKKIEYKIMKNWEGEPTDRQRVDMAQSLLDSLVSIDDTIVDNNMPTSLFGVNLDWAAGSANDAIVNMSLGIISEESDLAE